MPYTQDLMKRLVDITYQDFIEITSQIADGNIQYVYPYDLKLFIIEYAKAVQKFSAKDMPEC